MKLGRKEIQERFDDLDDGKVLVLQGTSDKGLVCIGVFHSDETAEVGRFNDDGRYRLAQFYAGAKDLAGAIVDVDWEAEVERPERQ